MENYIVINGKKAELTEDQLKALGIEAPKVNVFDRRKEGEKFYFINTRGEVEDTHETGCPWDNDVYNIANYCADETLMKQRVLHETLDRLLWRFSMANGGDKIDWEDTDTYKYTICYDCNNKQFFIDRFYYSKYTNISFCNEKIAQRAINEVIKPFIAAHPEFNLTL
jgi:hypothetical protein